MRSGCLIAVGQLSNDFARREDAIVDSNEKGGAEAARCFHGHAETGHPWNGSPHAQKLNQPYSFTQTDVTISMTDSLLVWSLG